MTLAVKDAGGTVVSLKYNDDDNNGILVQHNRIDSIPAIPAGSNAIGLIDIAPVQIILRQAIDVNASGDNIILAGITGKVIRILELYLVASVGMNLKLKSGSGLSLTGFMALLANQILHLSSTQPGYHHLECAVGQDFVINLPGADQIGGFVVYAQY